MSAPRLWTVGRWRLRHIGLAMAMVFAMPSAGQVQPIAGSRLKAAFILNFVRFTEWPARQAGSPIVLCVRGDDGIAEALDQTVVGQSIDGRALQVATIAVDGAVRDCQLLFIGERDPRRFAGLVEEAGRFPMLTVSDVARSSSHGVIVELFIDRARLRFAINTDTMARSGIKLSSRALALATIVRDAPVR